MGTRVGFRPRPLDPNKQLPIIRVVEELDNAETLFKDPAPGDAAAHGAKKAAKEIPVPEVRQVPTYYRDYLPVMTIPPTYLRGKGGVGYKNDLVVEYDLDNEDEDWLEQYSLGGSKLSDDKFERMLWQLELACAEAQEAMWAAAGASAAERMSATAVASTEALPRNDALKRLQVHVGGRDHVLRDVYQYWLAKRKRWGKPILRRLQAPTPANDCDPHRVFRPRDKVNRPQTRRRRENTEDCYEKLKTMKENLAAARSIVDEIVRRERRKRDLMCTELEFLNMHLQLHLNPTRTSEEVSTLALNSLKERMKANQQSDQKRTAAAVLPSGAILSAHLGRPAKRQRLPHVLTCLKEALVRMQLPPRAMEEDMGFTSMVSLPQLNVRPEGPGGGQPTPPVQCKVGPGGELQHPHFVLPGVEPWDFAMRTPRQQMSRVGRGGRVRVDRCDHWTGDSIAEWRAEQAVQQEARQLDAWPALPQAPHLLALIQEAQPTAPVFVHQQRAASRQSSYGHTLAAQASLGLASMTSAHAAALRTVQVAGATAAGATAAAPAAQLQPGSTPAAAAAAAPPAGMPVQAATAPHAVAMGAAHQAAAASRMGQAAVLATTAAGSAGPEAAAAAAAPAVAAVGPTPAAALPPVVTAGPDPAAAAAAVAAAGGGGWYGAAATTPGAPGNPAATVVAPTAPPMVAGAVQTPAGPSTAVAAKRTPAVKTSEGKAGAAPSSGGQLPPVARRGPGRPPKRHGEEM